MLGFEIDARYPVGVAALSARLPLSREDVLRRDRLADRVRQLLSARGGVAVTSSRLNRVIFLVPAAAGRASSFPSLSGCSLALGREHPGTAGVRRSYREALSILDQVPAGEVRHYEEMLIERVLGGDLEARDAFLDQLFGPLRRARGGGILLTTLVALAEDRFHQRHTSTRLHVHPNTLRYRLDRAADLLKADLTAPEWRFQLQLAARLLDPTSPLLRLRFMRERPFPFPPEPLRAASLALVQSAMTRADRTGRRGPVLSALHRLGSGFDS